MLGRDVLSRLLDGGWVLLLMALAATIFGLAVGSAAGISAAYLRGKTDGFIMRTVDVLLAFPSLVFALLLVSLVGPKLWLIVVAVGFSHAPQWRGSCARRHSTSPRADYVKSSRAAGRRPSKVMRRRSLPNLISPLMVETGLRLTYSIVIISGLGIPRVRTSPTSAELGLHDPTRTVSVCN